MLILAKILLWLSILWAATALAAQIVGAWGGGRKDYGRRAGSPARGVAYNLTRAMMPAHKETARRHPAKFSIGVVMHVGVIFSLVGVLFLLVWPRAGLVALSIVRPLAVLSMIAGVYLFVRRIFSRNLRAISDPDDFIAILATVGLLALVSLQRIDARSQVALLVYAALLLAYLPLGKLRHAVFFFAARIDHGRRLGSRGVYPPSTAATE